MAQSIPWTWQNGQSVYSIPAAVWDQAGLTDTVEAVKQIKAANPTIVDWLAIPLLDVYGQPVQVISVPTDSVARSGGPGTNT